MIKTEAIILSKIKYNDFSFITKLYSLELGMVSVLIRFSNSKRAKIKPNVFFPLNIVDTEFVMKNTRNIQSINYCNCVFPINNICENVFKFTIAQFISEILIKSIKEEISNPNLYNFIKETVIYLEKSDKPSNLHLAFLKDFAKALGFGITNNFCRDIPYFNLKEGVFLPIYTTANESLEINQSEIFSALLNINFENFENLQINNDFKKLFLNTMIRYFKFHFNDNFEIKSLEVLETVFKT
ncbi:MAG: DNA repair protein RecO [Bacteroidales bacterium]|jgi:DNA repair protein RecO (recombination protein O)|nr:DNA repair protein RecO [Bacteroidales bacterium]